MKYQKVILGGTFDHLHGGHVAMLTKAFEVGSHVWIGVTSQTFLSNVDPKSAKSPDLIEAYEKRLSGVNTWLTNHDFSSRATVISIDDKFGTTLTDELLEAIIVSPETELIATEINLLRAQKNWGALEVILVPWVLARDGAPIHSVRIRLGEIDRDGNLFALPQDWGVRKLPQKLREEFKKPMGELLVDKSYNHEDAVREFAKKFAVSNKLTSTSIPYTLNARRFLVSVGDAVTDALLKIGIVPDISIVDLQIQRKLVYKNIEDLGFRNIKVIKKLNSPAGTISFNDFSILNSFIRSEAKPSVLQVVGEEDLFALLALFLAPLGSLIVYGQPSFVSVSTMTLARQAQQGIVVVEVTEAKKELAKVYLEQFEQS